MVVTEYCSLTMNAISIYEAIEIAAIEAQQSIAAEQAEVLGEALKSAKIDSGETASVTKKSSFVTLAISVPESCQTIRRNPSSIKIKI